MRVNRAAHPTRARVALAGDEDRWPVDHGAIPGSEVLPIAIDVAVPVQRTRKPSAFELPRVRVEVAFAEPPDESPPLRYCFCAPASQLIGRTSRCSWTRYTRQAARAFTRTSAPARSNTAPNSMHAWTTYAPALRAGDTLVVWRLDRLGRGLKHLIEAIEQLHAREIGFRSLTEAIDTTTNAGMLQFHFFGAPAEFERHAARGMSLVMPSVRLCRLEVASHGFRCSDRGGEREAVGIITGCPGRPASCRGSVAAGACSEVRCGRALSP